MPEDHAQLFICIAPLVVLAGVALYRVTLAFIKLLDFLFPALMQNYTAGKTAGRERAYRQFRQDARNAHRENYLTKKQEQRKLWILKQKLQMEKTCPRRPLNRNFFEKG